MASDIKIQKVELDVTTSGETVTPSSGDGWTAAVGSLDNAFIINACNLPNLIGYADGTTNTDLEADDLGVEIYFTAVDSITISRESTATGTLKCIFYIVEYTGSASGEYEFLVRGRGSVSITAGSYSGTLATTSVSNIDDVIPFITSVTNDATSNNNHGLGGYTRMTATNTCTFYRGSSVSDTTARIECVEFVGAGWNVKHGRFELSTTNTDSGSITFGTDADGEGTASAVTWANAIIFHQHKGDATTGNQGIADMPATFERGTTSQVDFTFDSGHDNTGSATTDESAVAFVHILEDANGNMAVTEDADLAAASPTQNGYNYTTWQNIAHGASTTPTAGTSMALATHRRGGTGAAYARGWVASVLDSGNLANYDIWLGRSGNSGVVITQVVDFEGVEDSGSAGTATPTVVTSTYDAPGPTATGAGATAPSAVAATLDVPAPAAQAAATTTPAATAATLDAPTPTVTGAATPTPAVASTTYDVPTPTVTGAATASPAVVAATLDAPTPTVTAAPTPEPAVTTSAYDVPTPTVTGASAASPAVVAATFDAPTPTPTAAAVASPTVVPITLDAPAPTATAGSAAAPAVVASTYDAPTPTVLAAATTAPAVVPITLDAPTPTAGTSTAGTATPAVTTSTYDVPSPALHIGGVGYSDRYEDGYAVYEDNTAVINVPAATSSTYDIPAPTTSGLGVASPAVVAMTLDVPTPTAKAGATVTPAVVTLVFDAPTPSATSGLPTALPAVVTLVFDAPGPAAGSAALTAPAVVHITMDVPAPSLFGGAVATPFEVEIEFGVPPPSMPGAILTITVPEWGYLYRHGPTTRLILVGAQQRGVPVGFNTTEGWEKVTSVFRWNETIEGRAAIDDAVTAAWQANKAAATATLTAALNSALNTAGFRQPSGASL